jgi:hypothetical protein
MHGNEKIANVYNTKFVGLTLDNTLSWKTHMDTIIPKLNSVSFALRVAMPLLSQDSMIMVCYSLCNDLWINILRQIPIKVILFSDYKKELLESL